MNGLRNIKGSIKSKQGPFGYRRNHEKRCVMKLSERNLKIILSIVALSVIVGFIIYSESTKYGRYQIGVLPALYNNTAVYRIDTKTGEVKLFALVKTPGKFIEGKGTSEAQLAFELLATLPQE